MLGRIDERLEVAGVPGGVGMVGLTFVQLTCCSVHCYWMAGIP